MAERFAAGLAAEAELEKQVVHVNQTRNASPTIGSGTNDVKEQSPRQLHGWKVWRPDTGHTK